MGLPQFKSRHAEEAIQRQSRAFAFVHTGRFKHSGQIVPFRQSNGRGIHGWRVQKNGSACGGMRLNISPSTLKVSSNPFGG